MSGSVHVRSNVSDVLTYILTGYISDDGPSTNKPPTSATDTQDGGRSEGHGVLSPAFSRAAYGEGEMSR